MLKYNPDLVLAAAVSFVVSLVVLLTIDNVAKGLTASQDERNQCVEVYNG